MKLAEWSARFGLRGCFAEAAESEGDDIVYAYTPSRVGEERAALLAVEDYECLDGDGDCWLTMRRRPRTRP